MIKVEAVSKKFIDDKRSIQALNNISFNVLPGQIYGLIGLSGAGKSTALRTLNLLERPDSGQVIFNEQNLLQLNSSQLKKTRQKIGMIFQHFNLLANRTVSQNVAIPLEIAGWTKTDIQKRVKECLALVQLTDKDNAYPAKLSGGQKQRVAIARSIANYPKVLLADEPTSALDPLTKKEILSCLTDLNQKLGISIVITAHEMAVIKRFCHKVSVFKDGKIVETLDVINQTISPQTEYAKLLLEEF